MSDNRQTFVLTNGVQTFEVPPRVRRLFITAVGAGASGITAEMVVESGQTFDVYVGGAPVVPDDPDGDGYWTIQGGYFGGGSARQHDRPHDRDGVPNGFESAGGGSTELWSEHERLIVAPGMGGGWLNDDIRYSADAYPDDGDHYITDDAHFRSATYPEHDLLPVQPGPTDPPRVPYPVRPGGSGLVGGVPGGDIAGGSSLEAFASFISGELHYLWPKGGGGGFGGGASGSVYSLGLDGDGDTIVGFGKSRTGGWHVGTGVVNVGRWSNGGDLTDGFMYIDWDNPVHGGWSVGHIGM